MRRALWIAMGMIVGCGPPIHKDAVRTIADDLSRLGHPFGRFEEVEITDWRRGKAVKDKRYVDMEVRYVRGMRPEPNTMRVRVYQQSVSPCKITVDVLSDDGPDPLLLDNKLAANAMGDKLCREIEEL